MTVTSAITPSGRHIKAAMNTAAINAPTAIATGRLRFAGCAPERGLLTARPAGCPPRRRPVCTGGRRGMPDGSVPIVIRDGSRAATGSSSVGITSCCPVRRTPDPESSPGSVGESSFQTGDSEVNDDQTSSSSSVPAPGTVTSASAVEVEARQLAGRRFGPMREGPRVAGTERQTVIDSFLVASGLVLVEEWYVVLLVVTIPSPGVVRHRLSFPSPLLGHARTSSVPGPGTQTSRSSCSLRPNAPSMRSTCS